VTYHVGVLAALQDYGFRVGSTLILLDGWETRGKAIFNPRGSVNHHTAGAATGVLPSLNVLVNGRTGLPGPLCNCALDRLDRLWLIAAGGANHAGLGGWSGLSGNASVWGLEVEHVGTTAEPVGPAKWDAMHRFHAAVADYSGFSPAQVCQHFEWAPTRKVDFVKSITDGAQFRRNVANVSPGGDDDMSAEDVAAITSVIYDKGPYFALWDGHPAVWVVYKQSGTMRWMQNETMLRAAYADRVFAAGTDANGNPIPFGRSKAHLDTMEIVGPIPAGWEPPVPPG